MGIINNLKHGTVELLILTLLSEEDMYGYQIMQELKDRSNGLYSIKEGSLYPTMGRLVEKNFVTDREESIGKRRIRVYYNLTDKGKEELKLIEEEYRQLILGIEMIISKTKRKEES